MELPTYLVLPLPDSILEHPIRQHRLPVPQLIRRLNPKDGHTILHFRSLRQSVARRQRMREGKILRQQAQLAESRSLIPRDVLVIEPVASDIDDGSEWDGCFEVCGRDARQTEYG